VAHFFIKSLGHIADISVNGAIINCTVKSEQQ